MALGRERFPVASLKDASRIWLAFLHRIEATTGDSGFSHLGNGLRVVDPENKMIARISYNGRIWPSEENPNRKEHTMTPKKSSTKKASAKKTAPAATPEPEVVTTASKKAAKVAAKEKAPKKEKGPKEELCVFALRLTNAERDAIHSAAGPAKASKFARAILVAAARGDETLVREILKGINPPQS